MAGGGRIPVLEVVFPTFDSNEGKVFFFRKGLFYQSVKSPDALSFLNRLWSVVGEYVIVEFCCCCVVTEIYCSLLVFTHIDFVWIFAYLLL